MGSVCENSKIKNNKRNIGLEWLRIVSMLMIILLHSIDHSGLYESLLPGTALYYVEEFMYAAVQVCVNCFVLISGYFLVTSKFKLKKLGQLWVEVVFYALVIRLVMIVLGQADFSVSSLLSCFAPVITGRYWFITIYFGMYLLSPFYNIAIKAMNKNQHKALLVVLFVLFSVLISIHPSLKGMNSGNGWGLAWFTVLYFTAAYFRMYYTPCKESSLKYLAVFLACPTLMLIALFISQLLNIGLVNSIVNNFWRYDSVFAYIASASLLLVFLNTNFRSDRKISKFAVYMSSATLGVYLIHAHADICINKWWQAIGMTSNLDTWWFVFYQIFVVLAIFFVCAVIDLIRRQLFKLLHINNLVDKLFDKIERAFVKIWSKI